MTDFVTHDGGHPIPPAERCPDGSWSKFRTRHCVLPMGHTGPHEYEVRVIEPYPEDGRTRSDYEAFGG